MVVGTGNAGKLREFQAVLGPLGVEVCAAPAAYTAMDVEETGNTFEANARIKLAALQQCAANLPPGASDSSDHTALLTDDSGLLVDALGEHPGVRSARYAPPDPALSQDAANRRKLLQALRDVPQAERTARFVAVLALQWPGEAPQIYEGACHGRIATTEAGSGGFGYDPLFVPDGYNQTFAQLPPHIKNSHSHRGAALAKLVAALQAQRRFSL